MTWEVDVTEEMGRTGEPPLPVVSYGSWGLPMEHGAVCWLEPLMNVSLVVVGEGEAS